MARTAVGRTTIECCVRWCATRCAGSDTAEMTSAESWTSARPACSWCDVQQAASAASEAASWRLTVKALVERYSPHCSGLAGASEWCPMERRTAQSCNSRFSTESGCTRAFVLSPASVNGVCGGSLALGNCIIGLRLTRGYRKSGDDREWRRELTCIESATGRSTSAIDTDVKDDIALNCVAVSIKSALDTIKTNITSCANTIGIKQCFNNSWLHGSWQTAFQNT